MAEPLPLSPANSPSHKLPSLTTLEAQSLPHSPVRPRLNYLIPFFLLLLTATGLYFGLRLSSQTTETRTPAYTITPLEEEISGFSAQFDEFWDQGIDFYHWFANVARISNARIFVTPDEKLVLGYPNDPTVTQIYNQVYLYTGRLRLKDNFVLETEISDLTTQNGRAALEFWSDDIQNIVFSLGWEKASDESRVRGLVSSFDSFLLETPTAAINADKVVLRISRISNVIQFEYIVNNQVNQLGQVYPDIIYTGTGVIRLAVTPLSPGEPVEAKFDNLLGTINVYEPTNP